MRLRINGTLMPIPPDADLVLDFRIEKAIPVFGKPENVLGPQMAAMPLEPADLAQAVPPGPASEQDRARTERMQDRKAYHTDLAAYMEDHVGLHNAHTLWRDLYKPYGATDREAYEAISTSEDAFHLPGQEPDPELPKRTPKDVQDADARAAAWRRTCRDAFDFVNAKSTKAVVERIKLSPKELLSTFPGAVLDPWLSLGAQMFHVKRREAA